MAQFNSCIIIPVYNHPHIFRVIEQLPEDLPVILIDDGSEEHQRQAMKRLAKQHSRITLLRHESNQGKGGAVMTGLKAAYDKDFTHALQIDADGQHNTEDISALLRLSKENASALVSGQPIFHQISKSRYWARYITHVFVWLETLSFTIKDSMCGFRVYPLAETVKIIQTNSLGTRMDFDIEIMVKLFWQRVPILWYPTPVTYFADGISHFLPWRDNWLISYMHLRLFFGMLLRLPFLIAHKFGE